MHIITFVNISLLYRIVVKCIDGIYVYFECFSTNNFFLSNITTHSYEFNVIRRLRYGGIDQVRIGNVNKTIIK